MDELEETFVFDSYPQRVFIAILFIVVFVLGTIGNSLTIFAVMLSRKLQTVTNVFVINLAVADLLTCLTISFNIVAMFRTMNWPAASHWTCSIAGGILLMCIGVSIYTLATIALNRYILITNMSLFRKIYKPPVIVVWVSLLWFIPFCITMLPAIFGLGALGYNPKYKTCSDISDEYLPHINSTEAYDFIQVAGIIPIPLFVIFFSYLSIILYVRKNAKNLLQYKADRTKSMYGESTVNTKVPSIYISDTLENGFFTPSCVFYYRNATNLSMEMTGDRTSKANTLSTKKRSTVSKEEIQVTKNLFIVFCVFLVCLVPYSICLAYDDSDPVIPYAVAILFFNSCLNPVIYATRFPNFKKIILLILKCKWDKIPEPSSLLLRLKGSK
ncbi:G-protein coupled receptor moody [Holothuria leucospilota]|uniref:G-protein coupled receptor moody n=1 Tax=Holothuria leucospilota TaxID=206669 RepID=A0A9Q1BXU1_HOLLE|nr:G-protein coupled receptor moody [Holothuria leucospilota]